MCRNLNYTTAELVSDSVVNAGNVVRGVLVGTESGSEVDEVMEW